MARRRDHDDSDDGGGGGEPADGTRKGRRRNISRSRRGRAAGQSQPAGGRLRELGLSCMLNTEVGAVLAVIRRACDAGPQFLGSPDDAAPSASADSPLLQSLKSLRSLIFRPGGAGDWRSAEPSVYLGPFLDVIQSDDVPASATGVALSAVLKILKLGIFDEGTPGARDAIHSVVVAITNCRLERTDPASEDAVLMRILQVLMAVLRSPASVLLTDHTVCTVVNTCFQVVQQSACRGDLLQRNARYTMHELVQMIFSRLPEIDAADGGNGGDGYSDSDPDDDGRASNAGGGGGGGGSGRPEGGYGARCMVDIFQFLCSLLNVVEVVDSAEGFASMCSDEDIQLFALILINSAVELGGESIGRHPKLLRMIQDDLFHHLIHYGTCTSPLVLSMICSTVLNLYHFLRRSLRLQLEAFFTFVLMKTAAGSAGIHLQEVAVEGLISFCRQPTFVIEMYVNYDCDPVRRDIFEEIARLLCKTAFPVNTPLSPMQVQAFEGLTAMVGAIAENMDFDQNPEGETYHMEISEFRPFWMERCDSGSDHEAWVDFVRTRKFKKKKVMMAANHFNRDEKKGLDFLKISHLVPDPPDAKSLAYFYRYTPGLDKNKIGDYLGDPGEFNIQVLHEFAATFDFAGVILDTALRTFLETFRLPGESQKIQRILEAFSERFYDQQSADIFASKDAVFILCYSLIMLNTDQHNPQVKKKMTEEEFIRNNRAINGGKDLPREYLSELFCSISNNAITLFAQAGSTAEMTSNRWVELVKSSKVVEPFVVCDFEHRLGRDALAAVAGPSVAALAAIFEHTDDEDILQECTEGLLSIARISQYGLGDIIDELIACFCKFTSLLNPYATAEETLFTFTNDIRSRMATLAVFTIANKFGVSVRGGWRNMVDCLLKLKRLKLLPPSLMEPDKAASDSVASQHAKSESGGVVFPLSNPRFSSNRRSSGLMGRFTQFLSLDSGADSMANVSSEFENNMKIIQQCQIGSIFTESSKLPDESLQNLGRTLIFAAAGKGQKFSTPVEEEETTGFCWELLVAITVANIHRIPTFWLQFHDYLTAVAQFPLFSPCPFSEKSILGLFSICLKVFSTPSAHDKASEELIFKSINLIWKLDKEILDTCCEGIADSTILLLTEHRGAILSFLGWKTVFHLLSVTGRHPETYDRSVEALFSVMVDGTCISRFNYAYLIEAAFGFAALKISTLENSARIIDLMADSVPWLIQWHRSGYAETGGGLSVVSTASSSSTEDVLKTAAAASGNIAASLFMKLAEALRKISLVRREEIRNHAVSALRRCFAAAEELDLSPSNCIGCFNLIIFATVDDLHEKMLEYSRRDGSDREMRSMEGTLKEAMELLADVFLQFLVSLYQSPGFRTFWLGLLRRMDTCMKADLGVFGETSVLQDLVPELLKKMIIEMKEKEILVQRDGDELWDITNIQIQWIAPAVKDELFPEEF